MNKNGLYQIKQYYWLLYPTKDIAVANADALDHVTPFALAAAASVAYWSKCYNCNVSYISPNDIFCLLAEEGKFLKVVSTEGIGWMIVDSWGKQQLEEVTQ